MIRGRFVQRLLFTIVVLLVAAVGSFVLTLHVGDPVAKLAGPHATAAVRADLRHFYGLDLPVGQQLLLYLAHLVSFDFGISYRFQQPVAELIAERIPRTLLLGGIALFLQTLAGVVSGSFAAARHGRFADRAVLGATFVGSSLPVVILGPLLLLGVAYALGWLPVGGYGVGVVEHLECVLLPAATLAVGGAAYYARLTRSQLVEVLDTDFVRTARAKGAAPLRILVTHALRNALLPLVTSLGMSAGALLGGTVLVETIFGWPGMGKLAYDAVNGLDLPVIVGTVIVATAGTLAGNLGADLVCAWLDPRLRRPGGGYES
jgi:peptide/nickel transport system permease protein